MNWKVLIFLSLFTTLMIKGCNVDYFSQHILTLHIKTSYNEDISSIEVGVFKSEESPQETIEVGETNEQGTVSFTLPSGKYSVWVDSLSNDKNSFQKIFFSATGGEEIPLFVNKNIEVVIY